MRQHKSDRRERSFLNRLARDAGGNTLAIVGAALVPLTAMIGSGVDMSRAYMAKTRLQSACDAAALAGRRVMTNDTLSNEVRQTANEFFTFNFPQGLYQTAEFTPVVTRPDRGVVQVAATTTIPTSIMSMFGFTTLPLDVTCEASHDFVNTDIVLVLDVTGSMDANLDGVKMIQSLRDAVMALYDELAPIQAELAANGMRLRYSIVPYSSSVNVGNLIRGVNPAYLNNSWTYQSRSPIFAESSTQRVGTNMTNDECAAYAQARTPANSYPSTQKTVQRPGSGNRRACDVTTTTFTRDATETFSHWIYEPVVHDTSVFKTGAAARLPTRQPGTTTTSTWTGCIEERETVDTITAGSGYNIPANAFDLDIDRIPTNDSTRWNPHWPQVIYDPSGASMAAQNASYFPCPAPARRLGTMSRSDMQTYVNNLQPLGGTYHDIGMIWGARMISSAGVFADSPDTHNGMPVAKHIIFMTDGQMAANTFTYTTYGYERLDRRVLGTSTTTDANLTSRHNQRFKMVCNQVKGRNVDIWVVAFATTLSADMTECAKSPDHASTSNNRAQLIQRFTEIGKSIGALRLTQ